MNNITPMKMHIDVAHVRLIVKKKKLKLINIATSKHLEINHSW
jgi:hypothetical protein